MKSWIDLTNEEKEKYIKEFRTKYNGPSSNVLHKFNTICLILFGISAILVFMTMVAQTIEDLPFVFKILVIILPFVCIYNTINIKKEDKAFVNWLKTKNIIK